MRRTTQQKKRPFTVWHWAVLYLVLQTLALSVKHDFFGGLQLGEELFILVGFWWSYDGVLASSSTEFYGGQAWQPYTQGKFSECYLHFGCTGIYKYPRLTTNVYKDGATNLYESY